MPLEWQGRILGILFVGDDVGRTFTPDEAYLLRLFAEQATVALVNADLTAKEAVKSQRLEKLSRATKEISGELGRTTLQARLELIAKHVVEILDAEASSIFLKQSSGSLRLEAGYGYRPGSRAIGREYPICSGPGLGLTSHIAYEGTPFRKHGKALKEHWASDGAPPGHLPSGPRCSMLVLPLRKQGGHEEQLIGLIRAENKRSKDGQPYPTVGFTEEDEWILNIFAEAAVVAIESVRLVQEAKDARERLHASFQASSVLLSSQEPGKVLRKIVEQARVAADADGIRVILRDEAGAPRLVVATPKRYQNPSYQVRWPRGVSWEAICTGKPQIIPDIDESSQEINPTLVEEGTRAFCCMPLLLQGETIGVMSFYYDYPRHFPDFEIEALQLYANQAAAAYDSARRLDQVSKAKRAAEVVARVTALEGGEVTLESIARGTREAVGCDEVALYVYKQGISRLRHSSSGQPSRVIGVTYHKHAEHLPEIEPGPLLSAFLAYDEPYILENLPPEFLAEEFEKEWRIVMPLRVAEQKIGVMLIRYCVSFRPASLTAFH